MDNQNNNKNCGFSFRELCWILLLILSIIGNYYLITKKEPKTFDEKTYQEKIQKYENQINKINQINDSLNTDNNLRTEKISDLKNELKELNKKSKYYEDLYKKTLRSIDSMSDNDITHLFTKEFN